MAGCCDHAAGVPEIGQQRRVLVVVLAINLVMFVVEIGAGWRA